MTNDDSLSEDELRDSMEILSELDSITPDQACKFFDDLGGYEKVTLDLYGAVIRRGNFDLAVEMIDDMEARTHHPDPETAQFHTGVLARMRHCV